MCFRKPVMFLALRSLLLALCSLSAAAQTNQPPEQVCKVSVTVPIVVASAEQRRIAGQKAEPPITDMSNGFAWPDTPISLVKTSTGYVFFGSDGALHSRQMWQGKWVGNNKYGAIVTTMGTLNDPLGTAAPLDVSISANPDPSVNPNYSSYTYMGSGPVYQVPTGMTGAGNLLAVYHAEVLNDQLYAVLGLASSTDAGLHWTDLGEIIRLNQAFAPGLQGFEIGDGPLVLSPDGKYFYLYFPDWISNGTLLPDHTTNVSVARALAASVLDAAFGPGRQYAIPFHKFYRARWDLQPGIGGASTDLNPTSQYSGYLDIHFNSAIQRYVMIISNDTTFAYSESTDALNWTVPVPIATLGNPAIAAYPTAVGLGADPRILGNPFYVYFTHLPNDGTGWANGTLRRFTLTCK